MYKKMFIFIILTTYLNAWFPLILEVRKGFIKEAIKTCDIKEYKKNIFRKCLQSLNVSKECKLLSNELITIKNCKSLYNFINIDRLSNINKNTCVLVVASAKYRTDMEDYIKRSNIQDFTIYKTKKKGWYSISPMNINYKNRRSIIKNLIKKGKIPNDSYCLRSNKLLSSVHLYAIPNQNDINSSRSNTSLNLFSTNEENISIKNKLPYTYTNLNKRIKIINEVLEDFSQYTVTTNNKLYTLDKSITMINDKLTDFKFKPKNNLEIQMITSHIEWVEKELKKINQQFIENRLQFVNNSDFVANNSKIYSLIQENNLSMVNSKILDIYSRLNKINNHNNLIDIQKSFLKSDINLTTLNYQESFNEMNEKMENILKVENMFKLFSINENIDLFFAEIDDKNKYNSKFIYEIYLYGFIFLLFTLLSFFILRFKYKYINQEIIYLEEPKSLLDVDESSISKLIASRVFSYVENYDRKIVIFKNAILFIIVTSVYIILFYFWYSYIHKFDRLNMLEEYKYKVQLEQSINYQNIIIEKKANIIQSKIERLDLYITSEIKQLGLYFDKQKNLNQTIDKNFQKIQIESTKHINNFKTKVIQITDEMKKMKHQINNMRVVPAGTKLTIKKHDIKKF
ncbi:MAG TPA: hypothetical protein EYG89_05500 [Bacteroidia bacterium]|nr:hypothetical protein [Bacteroidia bacterium]